MRVDTSSYDAFACHSSKDKDQVREICSILSNLDFSVWIDEEDIPVGVQWYSYIFNNINKFDCILVFVGRNGIGSVQEDELESILRKFEGREKSVVPILLPGVSPESEDIPAYIINQIIDRYNYVDFEKGREKAIIRIVSGILQVSPRVVPDVLGDKAITDSDSIDKLPQRDRYIEESSWFVLGWAILHWLGFASVNIFTGPFEQFEIPGVIATTLLVWGGLVYLGWRQINYLSIPMDRTGAAVGGLIGAAVSYMMVLETQNLGVITSVAGFATTVATSLLAGAAGGAWLGFVAAMFGGTGSFIAALLTPWFNSYTQGALPQTNIVVAILALSIGAAFWGAFLALCLKHIFENFKGYR